MCNKKFKHKSEITKYHKMKNICDKNLACIYCKKIITRKSNLKLHYLTCKFKIFVDENKIVIKDLQMCGIAHVENLKKDYLQIENITHNNTPLNEVSCNNTRNIVNCDTFIQKQNNITHNTQNNNFKNTILNFLDIKLDATKITESIHDGDIMEKLINHTYLNVNNPNNHVLLITDFRRNYMQFYQNGEWYKTIKNAKLTQLLFKTYYEVVFYVEEQQIQSLTLDRITKKIVELDKKYIKNLTKYLNMQIYLKKIQY